ncbi:guanitoxin biosynthesis heme-dependent pre-guanitoxin N-hydroxylase GntA [Bdellovibrio bacteriovorus]|uniref:YqcI/YcgG family protein n=1 Tax=Bdellovibrio bacteriovorus TaxID=959 RepID=A0A1Z3N7T0_BDEBC|nr:guanitoxin biosynthesis heme-dependent pre-guanitoxin N-hydroxylase GntA [Bdellovibrio bacteriovorus]ASD63499.1 hypothetical protein B9G79_07905 [Bdellovibrio bacteriovorus]
METHQIEADLKSLINQRHYPCVAAIQALHHRDYTFDVYEDFGTGDSRHRLALNLIRFKHEQRQSQVPYLSYFAIYPNDRANTEEEFERKMWRELSALWEDETIAGSWDPQFSDNPEEQNFCFSLDGSAYFVVGLHPAASRISRRLPYNVLVFNLYSQFTELMKKGTYDAMVKVNRDRDRRFQGSVNPMAETYNESWESIQFSGRNNPPDWKCPFTKGLGILRSKLWK